MAALALAGAADVPEVRTRLGSRVEVDWTHMALESSAGARGFGVGATPRAVEQQARREVGPGILEGVGRVRLTHELTVADLQEQPEVWEAVQSRVSRWSVSEARYYASGKVELVGALSLQELLKPWTLHHAVPAPEGPQPTYTGLLVDARGSGAEPAFSPRLLTEGGEVLWEAMVWEEHALEQVAVVYVSEPSHPVATRAGDRPMVLRCTAAQGPDLVLDADETVRFRTGLAGARVLGEGTVVVVLDP